MHFPFLINLRILNIGGMTVILVNFTCDSPMRLMLKTHHLAILPSQCGWSALMAAVYKRHDDVALRMIEAGATPHIQDQV